MFDITSKKELANDRSDQLLNILKTRFEKNMARHKDVSWDKVQAKLVSNPAKLWSLNEMEETGGEPDVVTMNKDTGKYIFIDCSPESPIGRRNLCYDSQALEARKKFKPKDSAINMAEAMGIDLLTEEEYQKLQSLGKFDTNTSSWLQTPEDIRKLGGAIFADCRYNHVFVFHNGAESYYGVRGFRGSLTV